MAGRFLRGGFVAEGVERDDALAFGGGRLFWQVGNEFVVA